jgi:hypothetical protein
VTLINEEIFNHRAVTYFDLTFHLLDGNHSAIFLGDRPSDYRILELEQRNLDGVKMQSATLSIIDAAHSGWVLYEGVLYDYGLLGCARV